MTTREILAVLQGEIHTTVFATVDDDGLPQTCVIDLMLADENGLYFLTAKGKSFYRRLMAKPFVALSGMKGKDTLSSVAISVRGRVRCIGKARLDEIFEKNPYMAKIYPTRRAARRSSSFISIRARANTSISPGCRRSASASASAAKHCRSTSTASRPGSASAAQAS